MCFQFWVVIFFAINLVQEQCQILKPFTVKDFIKIGDLPFSIFWKFSGKNVKKTKREIKGTASQRQGLPLSQ